MIYRYTTNILYMLNILNKFKKYYTKKVEFIIMPINNIKILHQSENSWNNNRKVDKVDNVVILESIRSILNKLSNTNYDIILKDINKYCNNDMNFILLKEIVNIFYDKMSLDHKFINLYVNILDEINNITNHNLFDILISVINNNFNNKNKNYIDSINKEKIKLKINGIILIISYLFDKKKINNVNYYLNNLSSLDENKELNDLNCELICTFCNNNNILKILNIENILNEVKIKPISKRIKFLLMDIQDKLK